MKTETFFSLIAHPENLTADTLAEVDEIVREYPFSEVARRLLLLNLRAVESLRFEAELKRCAPFISNKQSLYDALHRDYTINNMSDLRPEVDNAKAGEVEKKPDFSDDYFASSSSTYELVDEEPALQSADDKGSFVDWLQYVDNKPLEQEASARNVDLIEAFLNNQTPPANTPSRPTNRDVARADESENDDILTETLAGIYVNQRQYDKAINIFRRLSLKNPEKSTYFALRISEIEKLTHLNQ